MQEQQDFDLSTLSWSMQQHFSGVKQGLTLLDSLHKIHQLKPPWWGFQVFPAESLSLQNALHTASVQSSWVHLPR